MVYLLAIVVAPVSCHLYATSGFSFGTLNLSSSSSARNVHTVHSWTQKDLPGMSSHYCGPAIAGDSHGVVYAFAGSACVDDNGFYPSAILAYDLAKKSTTVYGDIPKAVYKDTVTAPGVMNTFLDEKKGVFYVVTVSNVEHYDFDIWMLLEFNPRSGNTTALVTLPLEHEILEAVYDAQLQLVVLSVDVAYVPNSQRHQTAIFDTSSSTLTWNPNNSAILPSSAGFDPVEGKILAIQNVGGENPKTNYEFGHLTCSETGCAFTSKGELDQLWCGVMPEYGSADKIKGLAWDPSERLLSVQSSGCYNISTGAFECHSNLGTEKFMQYHIPANLSASPPRVVTARYEYVQATNYNDGLAMDWSGLTNVASPTVGSKDDTVYMQSANYNDGLAMDWSGLTHVATPNVESKDDMVVVV